MPAAMHISRSPCIALAVIATMRGRSPLQRALMRRVASRPSISGICTSMSIDVVGLALDRFDRLDAVRREVGAITHLLQEAQRELLVHDVVLGEQDAQRMAVRELGIERGLGLRRGPGRRARARAGPRACREGATGGQAWRGRRRTALRRRPPRAARASSTARAAGPGAHRACAWRVRRRPSRACACRGRPTSKGSPAVDPRAAPRAGESVSRVCMPHFVACSVSTRRLVALSSTTSSRLPARPGLHAGDAVRARGRQRRRSVPRS